MAVEIPTVQYARLELWLPNTPSSHFSGEAGGVFPHAHRAVLRGEGLPGIVRWGTKTDLHSALRDIEYHGPQRADAGRVVWAAATLRVLLGQDGSQCLLVDAWLAFPLALEDISLHPSRFIGCAFQDDMLERGLGNGV